jgi:hydrogenase-4 transcriptional activator
VRGQLGSSGGERSTAHRRIADLESVDAGEVWPNEWRIGRPSLADGATMTVVRRTPAEGDSSASPRDVGQGGRMARHDASPWAPLLMDIWRQVSEHLDIATCCEAVWARMKVDLPVHRMCVRRIDRPQACVETVAVVPWRSDLAGVPTRLPLDPDALAAMEAWVRRADVSVPTGSVGRVVAPWAAGAGGTLLAGGLVDAGVPVGSVAIEVGGDPVAARSLLAELLHPLVVALRNDQRIHELAQLREAVEADNRALLSRLARDGIAGAVVGSDGGLRDVMAGVRRVCQTDAPVLLLGETGTGKELVAREIHNRSHRARGPFLKVNCGAIPSELVDSELFGHDKGSFTGAVADRRGWFERADGGTLFLDEIAELPPAAQVRLLRVLQDGTFERVGGQRPLHADVRIVAATHRDLRGMATDGRFREDLWHRIGVFPLRIPPLRERLADLTELAAHFAARAGERLHGRPLLPNADDLRLLRAYPWPGNVRELGAVIERAAILGDGQRLDVAAALGVQVDAAPKNDGPRSPAVASNSEGSLEAVNRRAICEALRVSAGKVEGRGGAAARLGLSPSTLRSRMKRLEIDWQEFRPGFGEG